ncbi:Na+/H+ antiporter NhaA [Herbaspirillum sp. LeCh32-8]|uniref:Na+/H+ antiporter NhaA n=1 Tax=Herbaspirillum sp. LeCh32-8 TaxID=2821356 RepID=UPI001AE37544|nr:Na+/H+ antiporter NhaA [Herbaspirillum sp. LeCh32-8]MBP0597252.1 Na+/H+ antiporter NhaA [Herbaspirillum sp. LeCh32-8]
MAKAEHHNDGGNAFTRFFAHEAAGGIVLAIAAVLALVISNSGWREAYEAFTRVRGTVDVGGLVVLSKPLLLWVNELWMAVFFFLVGLEIKREFVEGELASRSQAILPAVAALGGMAVPALIYAAINLGDPVALRGWAIPAATDIAFAIGIVMLLGSRVPTSLKVFLTAVAIIDDLGAIVVIALFYTDQLSLPMLAGAGVGTLLLILLNRSGVRRADVYLVVGLAIWVCVLKSGIHATLAGVVTALAIPMKDGEGKPLAGALEHGLHPWVAFLVLPMFAFANAGVSLQGMSLDSLFDPIPLGIAAGLVLGKTIGVFGAVWLMVKSGLAAMPAGASTRQVIGVCVLCGIGFTMSLFIGGLAFQGLSPDFEAKLKLGVLGGSILAGLLGTAVLWRKPAQT